MDLTEYLDAVERTILLELHTKAPKGLEGSQVLLEGGMHLTGAPGAKRARPKLVYYFGQAVHAKPKDLINIAIAAEFIHGASLLHDDVVDYGTVRRGRPTVNAQWDNHVAVLGGDIMLCISIQRLCMLPRIITKTAIDVVSLMSRAAILEVNSRGNIDLALEQWKHIALGKTGALFAWCGRAPAMFVANEDANTRFQICGEHLGIAFQLADDLKDLTCGDFGKDRFADILNKNPSYPVLTAASRSHILKEEIRTLWAQNIVTSKDALRVGQHVMDTGAADITRDLIMDHVTKAFDALGPYRDSEGGEAVANWANTLAQSYLASHN